MFNTLNSYGTAGSDGFLFEGEIPTTTDSEYQRHSTKGGVHSGKKTNNDKEKADGIINISKN